MGRAARRIRSRIKRSYWQLGMEEMARISQAEIIVHQMKRTEVEKTNEIYYIYIDDN